MKMDPFVIQGDVAWEKNSMGSWLGHTVLRHNGRVVTQENLCQQQEGERPSICYLRRKGPIKIVSSFSQQQRSITSCRSKCQKISFVTNLAQLILYFWAQHMIGDRKVWLEEWGIFCSYESCFWLFSDYLVTLQNRKEALSSKLL